MKKISLILFITLISTTLSAQHGTGELKINWYKSGWFIDGNAGVRFIGEASDQAEMQIRPTLNAGLGHFFNEKIGIKGRLDAHQFSTTYGNTTDLSLGVGASAQVVVRLLQAIKPKLSRSFALNLHAGGGLSAIINPSFRNYVEEDLGQEYDGKLFNADNMGHIIIGLTPQFHLNSRVSVNIDFSHFTQFKQDNTYDTHNQVRSKDITGVIATTVGLTVRL